MEAGISAAMLPALVVYLLIGGAFTAVLLKALKVRASIVGIYGFLYLVFTLASSIIIYIHARRDVLIYTLGGYTPLIGIAYEVDLFSASMGLIVSLLALAMYPLLHLLDSVLNEYTVALYLGLVAGLLGVVYTGDVFNSFVMLEVLTISMLGLLASSRSLRAYKATLRYGLLAFVTGIVYFLAATLLYFAVGALNMGYIASWNILPGTIMGKALYGTMQLDAIILFPLILMTWSILAEEALAPLHFWLPDAYSSAPPSVSGLLAGVGEAVGYYLLLRLYYTLYSSIPGPVALSLRVLGVITMLIGGFGLVYSNRLLKMISYTVILDTGYIAVAVSLGPEGVPIALSYVVAHAVVKPLLFITSGWAVHARGSDSLDDLKGVFRSSRLMQLGFVTGAIAVIGIPPTILFSAKLSLYTGLLGALSSDPTIMLSLITALLGSGLALAGFIKVISSTILSYDGAGEAKPATSVKAYVAAFTILVLVLGLLYQPLIEAFINPASSSLVDGRVNYVMKALLSIIGVRG